MALAATVDTLDDVPEPLREHYVARNGKFVLDTEGDPRIVNARREAQEERRKRQELETKLKAFGDLKPEDIEPLRTRRRQEDQEDETAAQRMQRLRDELDRTKRDGELTMRERDSELTRLKGELVQERIGTRIRSVAQAKLQSWAIDDAVLNGMRTFRQDDAGKVVAFDGDERLLGKNGEDLTIDEWLDGMRQARPGWFAQNGTGNQGGGAQHQSTTTPSTRARPKTRSEMTPSEKAACITDLGMDGYLDLPA